MIFTSFAYLVFLAIVFVAYWLIRNRTWQNILLLGCSYLFYGYVHPWFCILIAASTVVDYYCGMGMGKFLSKRKLFLIISLCSNLGMLGFFKYFNFFTDSIIEIAGNFGFQLHERTWQIALPWGISFYTFQTLSYTIDVYRGKLEPRKNFLDFALFVSFFPQLTAGPIERASRLLPQIEKKRSWNWDMFLAAWPLFVRGYLKKMVIADNVALYVDKIYMLESPTLLLLIAGTVAFAIQIYADFSAYTDIARGSAKLLGFDLMKNFNSPYLAITPSDFWKRWHISFSSWIQDYLYIPLGGSRASSQIKFALILLVTLGLSGLWHGAAWHFVAWGIFHAAILFVYHRIGITGKWNPQSKIKRMAAWMIMICLTMVGWSIFRASSLTWLVNVFKNNFSAGFTGDSLVVAVVVFASVAFYCMPLFVLMILDRAIPKAKTVHAVAYAIGCVAILVLFRNNYQDFIYFQF